MVLKDRNEDDIPKKNDQNEDSIVDANVVVDEFETTGTIDMDLAEDDSDTYSVDEIIEKSQNEDDAKDIFGSNSKVLSSSSLIEPPLIVPASEISEERILEVVIDYNANGVTKISRDDAEKLAIKTGNIISISDLEKQHSYKCRIVTDVRVEPGTILCDASLHMFSDISSEKIIIERVSKNLIHPEKISLTIKTSNSDAFSTVAELRKNIDALRNFLSHYILYRELKIHWKSKDIVLRVAEINPKLTNNEVALLDLANACLFSIRPEGLVPFNAILLMDNSKSMIGKDLEVKNIQPIIKQMKEVFGNVLLTDFLKEFQEGNFVKRKSGAAFAALFFLTEKVRRGLDETVSIIHFADDAEILRVNGKPFVNSTIRTREIMKMAELIIQNVDEKEGAGTNMTIAVENCPKILEALPRNKKRNPTLVILLTDGFDTSAKIRDAVEKTLLPQGNIVLYSVGIGPFVNRKELQEISKLCGGEIFLPEDLNQLVEWYRKLARDLSIHLGEIDF